MKKTIFFLLFLSFYFFSCKNQNEQIFDDKQFNKNSKIILSTYSDTINYVLGVVLGENLKQYGIKEVDFNMLNNGMADALSSTTSPSVNINDARRILALYLNKVYPRQIDSYKRKNLEFLKKNAKKNGINVLPSGIQYKIVEKGNGISPSKNDIVEVNYQGWLIDGTSIGNTFNKAPVKFPVNKAIKGWQIILPKMKEGDTWIVYIPPQYAFGKKGGKKVKPNSVVIYKIQLLKVYKK